MVGRGAGGSGVERGMDSEPAGKRCAKGGAGRVALEPDDGITGVAGGESAPQKRIKRLSSDSAIQAQSGESEVAKRSGEVHQNGNHRAMNERKRCQVSHTDPVSNDPVSIADDLVNHRITIQSAQ